MTYPTKFPAELQEPLAEIENALQRLRSAYLLGSDPYPLVTTEIITIRVELLRLWSLISPENARVPSVKNPS